MDFQATFSNQSGQAKTLDIKDGFNLQDAYNVVANDDFAPTQITLEPINMNSSYSNVEPDKQVETAYDLIGRHSSNDIIDKHKISSDELAALLEEGTNHELEHTSSYLIAMKIAQDHLYEDLMYYSKLKEAMLARGAALNMSKVTPKYAEGTKLSYPIYVRLKANVDKFAVMNFLNQYPKVEDVMNRYVRTPNVKAGYLTFMADKDANDQNLEQWGAKVKGYYESPDGTKIKRYEWNFGEAEGFAEVFQYLYDKHNGYAKGGVMGKDYSEKMMSSAYAMPFQDWFNKNIMDVTESYNDAKRDYEDGQNKPFGIKLGKYAKSLHNEFAKNNNFKDGGDVDEKNLTVSIANDEQGERMYKMAENEIPYVGKPRLVLLDGKKVLGGVFVEQSESYELNGETITPEIHEYKFDIIISRSHRGKGYAKLLIDRLILDFIENFPDAQQIRAEVINKKLGKYLVSRYGFDCDSDNDEDMTYCYLSREQAKKRIKKLNIKFEKGGYVDNKNYYRAVTEDLGLQTTFVPQNRYEAFDNEGNPITRGASDVFMLSDKLEISASKSVGGAILGLWSMYNSNGINPVGKKVYVYAISKKPYKDLSGVRMADFEYLKEVRYDRPISAKRVGYFEYDQKFNEDALNFYGRISDDDPYSEMEYDIDAWEDFEQYILTLNITDLDMYKTGDIGNPNIRFDKGGYVSEEVLIENNIGKIDDIYVLSENDKPVKSLGQFTFKGFGKLVMKDLAGELYDDYKIRLRSDFAIMLGNDIIKPSIKVAQMKGNEIELLAIIYNALVTDEQPVSYVFNEDGEVVGKFTDEDFAEDMVNDNDGYYSEVRVEEVSTPETILAMQFDFNKQEMTFVSTLLEKQSTHKFKYGGKL